MLTLQPYMFGVEPVNMLHRSPYETNYSLPPDYHDMGEIKFVNGIATVRGVPLGSVSSMQGAPAAGSQVQQAAQNIIPTYNRGSYGDSSILVVNFTGAGLPVDAQGNPLNFVLQRPNNTRTLLLVVNQTVPGPIFYNFDQVADNVASVQIPQGGNRNWGDTVPQGNLSLFSNGAGTAIIEYINANVTV